MMHDSPEWLAPTSLEEALELRAQYGEDATVVAGGTYLCILINQGFLVPRVLLSLHRVPNLGFVETDGVRSRPSNFQQLSGSGSDLRLGAMATHRAVERSAMVREKWPALARAFSLVASPRVRNQATVGGVIADADYASDPPTMLTALGARVVLRSVRGEREVAVEEFILGYYETDLQPDELLVEVRVPADVDRAVYRKFRSRSTEDRPCVAVAAAQVRGRLCVVVGAVTERPQQFPEVCALAGDGMPDSDLAAEIGSRYADGIEPISDSRGSSTYRRRIIAVEVRRALSDLAHV